MYTVYNRIHYSMRLLSSVRTNEGDASNLVSDISIKKDIRVKGSSAFIFIRRLLCVSLVYIILMRGLIGWSLFNSGWLRMGLKKEAIIVQSLDRK